MGAPGVTTPRRRPGNSHVYHLYVVRHSRRDDLHEALKASGVGTLIHYPVPIHLQPAYRYLATPGALPVTEQVAQEILSLPLYPEMTDAQVDEVAAAVRRAVASL